MERKIGEIFEYDGEWYQCVEQCVEHEGCHSCAFDISYGIRCSFNGVPYCSAYRSDGKHVIFKKLEKVGETYEKRVSDGAFSTFQKYKVYNSVILPQKPYMYCNFIDNTIEIEIKQTKEDMEENKLSLKPFDIQKAREGKPVCTRDGRKARILCFDRFCCDEISTIVACVLSKDRKDENVIIYSSDGFMIDKQHPCADDLMMRPEKRLGWVNVYKNQIHDTPKSAEEGHKGITDYIKTIRVEWEE